VKIKLTDAQWREVLRLRCLTKRGQAISAEQMALLISANADDPARYGALDSEVFRATAPFGSGLGMDDLHDDGLPMVDDVQISRLRGGDR